MRLMTLPLPRILPSLLLPLLALSPFIAAAAPQAAIDTAPASSCTPDPYSCPDWMPSQAQIRRAVADYFCALADRGLIAPTLAGPVVAESSPVTCAALGREPGSNFVCGGEIRFVHSDGRSETQAFSPTLHHDDKGRIAFYEGDDAGGNEIWRAPAPREHSRYCAPASARHGTARAGATTPTWWRCPLRALIGAPRQRA
jgi:hypothetical protein